MTIVVGVDGSPNSIAALEWAIEEAALRNTQLDVVLVWHEPYVDGNFGLVPTWDHEEFLRSYRAQLDKIIAGVDASALATPPRAVLLEGSVSGGLVAAAGDADLLVVGSRGHGGFVGLLLGSVSHQVAAHAPCPVVVVPAAASTKSA